MSKNIAVIIGGPSSEHDISILTGLQSARILSKNNKVSNIVYLRTSPEISFSRLQKRNRCY